MTYVLEPQCVPRRCRPASNEQEWVLVPAGCQQLGRRAQEALTGGDNHHQAGVGGNTPASCGATDAGVAELVRRPMVDR